MADIDTTIGNLAGTAVGVGVAVWGMNAVTKQLNRSVKKTKRRKPTKKDYRRWEREDNMFPWQHY